MVKDNAYTVAALSLTPRLSSQSRACDTDTQTAAAINPFLSTESSKYLSVQQINYRITVPSGQELI